MAKANPNSASTAVAAAASTAVAVAGDDYAAYAGSGFENQDASDYAIPFLAILQALSPQIANADENSPFRQGQIINSVTGEFWSGKDGVVFIPSTTQHVQVEWKPREAGGGLVAIHELNSDFVKQVKEKNGNAFGTLPTPDGNELIETFYVYGVAVDKDGNEFEAVISFSGTKIKAYKGWMTKAKTIQLELGDGRRIVAPLFAHRYRITTVSEKNNKGQFFNWVVGFDGDTAKDCRLAPSSPLFLKAVAIKKLIEDGKARAATESLSPNSESVEGGGDRNGASGPKAEGKAVF